MATKKKKKKSPAAKPSGQTMTPKQYFLAGRPRSLELHECLINGGYQDNGMAVIVVARKHKTGNITFASFMVDIFCLGVKDAGPSFNRLEEDYEHYKSQMYNNFSEGETPISYDLAHNIIFGAVDYATKLGFKPHKDWEYAQFILEPKDSPNVEKMDIEFGKDGKPFYISGPYDRVDSIINKLNHAVGPNNYTYIAQLGGSGGFGYDNLDFMDDGDDDEDDDDNNDENETEDVDYEEVKS